MPYLTGQIDMQDKQFRPGKTESNTPLNPESKQKFKHPLQCQDLREPSLERAQRFLRNFPAPTGPPGGTRRCICSLSLSVRLSTLCSSPTSRFKLIPAIGQILAAAGGDKAEITMLFGPESRRPGEKSDREEILTKVTTEEQRPTLPVSLYRAASPFGFSNQEALAYTRC